MKSKLPRLQVGACPLHFPLLMHLLVELPCNLNPGLHLYLAMEPGLFPLTLTDPYLGGRSLGQVRATIKKNNSYLAVLTRTEMIDIVPRLQVGACPLHFPLLMHLLVELPCNLNPGLHLYLAMEPGLFPLTLTEPYLGGLRRGQVLGVAIHPQQHSYWGGGGGEDNHLTYVCRLVKD